MEINSTYGLKAEGQRYCEKHQLEYTSGMFVLRGGVEYWTSCTTCTLEKQREQLRHELLQMRKEGKQQGVAKLFKQTAIPPKFNDNTFDNYIIDNKIQSAVKNTMVNFANDITNNLKSGRSVILSGNAGNGKTHLSVATAKIAMEKEHTTLFTTCGEMIDKIHEAGWHKAKIIENYTEPELLILDEVSYAFNNEEQKSLFKVINKRYELKRSTIIISNLSAPDLKNILGGRIYDRLRENQGILLLFTWDSYRK